MLMRVRMRTRMRMRMRRCEFVRKLTTQGPMIAVADLGVDFGLGVLGWVGVVEVDVMQGKGKWVGEWRILSFEAGVVVDGCVCWLGGGGRL